MRGVRAVRENNFQTRAIVRCSLVMRRPPLALLMLSVLGASCGPVVRHDLGSVPQSAITFDDMCHLQDYFDQRVDTHAPPLRVVDELSTETSRVAPDEHGQMRAVVIGEGTYLLRSHSDRVRFRRLLRDEYRRLPEGMELTAPEAQVSVRVTWWQAGGIRRVRNDGNVVVSRGDESWTLPPQPCVGEFLFGESAYVMRRCFLEADRARSRGEIPGECSVAATDASTSADASADAGASDSAPSAAPAPSPSPSITPPTPAADASVSPSDAAQTR